MNLSKPIKWLFAILLNLGMVTAISLLFYLTQSISTTQTISLPQGSITNTIVHLKKEGYPLTVIDTYLLAYVITGQPKSGTLIIGKGKMQRIDFLRKLTNAKEAINIITLIPGETRTIFLENLAKEYHLDVQKLNSAYDTYATYKEAGIVPDTYHIPKHIDENKLIQILVKQSDKRYEEYSKKELKHYNKKEWLKILTKASVIQKEAANNQEMPIVASVINNRLTKEMALQMDGTLNYGKYSHIKVTPKRIREDKSGFNTYLNKGLPLYPVCSVSMDAINAVLHPKKTNYLYFMKNKLGVHDFTKSYQEHLRNIQKAK